MVSLLCEAGVIDPARSAIGHFDHRLRDAAASAADRVAVEALGARYGLPVVTDAWPSPRPGEAAAREARYSFLRRVATERGSAVVATGHTSDDQAETVLLHAMRGAGLHGLAGMAPLAAWPFRAAGAAPLLARPLLAISRAETRAWCAAHAIAFNDDVTNDDRTYARNRLRLDLLPRLSHGRPDVRASLIALSSHARDLAAAIDASVAHVVSAQAGVVLIDRVALAAMPEDSAGHAFRLALVRLLGDARDFGRRHYAALARAATHGATGATLILPRGVVVTVDPAALLLSAGAPVAPTIDPALALPLPYGGEVGAWRIGVARATSAKSASITLPRDAIIRRRRPGDRMRLRDGRHAKLQDVLVDRKAPRRLRDAMPVIAFGGEVWWTPWGSLAHASDGDPYVIDARLSPEYGAGVVLP
jgi:tRNA(Ile)-lysidine synthetase-like protein